MARHLEQTLKVLTSLRDTDTWQSEPLEAALTEVAEFIQTHPNLLREQEILVAFAGVRGLLLSIKEQGTWDYQRVPMPPQPSSGIRTLPEARSRCHPVEINPERTVSWKLLMAEDNIDFDGFQFLRERLLKLEAENRGLIRDLEVATKETWCCEQQHVDGVPGWWHCPQHGRRKSKRQAEVDELRAAIFLFKKSKTYRDFSGHLAVIELVAVLKNEE